MASYNFSSYRSNPSIRGNWNTGGSVVGRGSLAGGITPVGVERNRLGGVIQPQIAPRPPSVMPVMTPPTPQVPSPNPLTQGWSSLPMGPPQTTPAFQPAAGGWNSLPMGPPQTVPSFVNKGSTINMTPAADPSANYGNDQFGRSLMNNGFGAKNQRGSVGGGFGGGGGGGH